jgi:hypothetical protein
MLFRDFLPMTRFLLSIELHSIRRHCRLPSFASVTHMVNAQLALVLMLSLTTLLIRSQFEVAHDLPLLRPREEASAVNLPNSTKSMSKVAKCLKFGF